MIHFPATLEVALCLIGGIVIGLCLGWLIGSMLVGLGAGIAFFCWLMDIVFSFSMEEDELDEY